MPELPKPPGPARPLTSLSVKEPLAADLVTGRSSPGFDVPLLGVSFMAMCLLGGSGVAVAGPAFIPPVGVTQYRLAFITNDPLPSIVATSTDIATYNQFAAAAAATSASLPATEWFAIASTRADDAASNISCGTACDANVPILLFDGTEVAASADDLFAGSILNLIDEDQFGNSFAGAYVWTGSNADGTGASGLQLGTSTPVTGWDFYTSDMINVGFDFPNSNTLPIYAISGVLGTSSVPEPASLALLALGGVATGVARRLRRKRPTKE